MRVPNFLLRRLYVKGSLQPTAEGFQFQIRNRLGSGYARRLFPLTLDGGELEQRDRHTLGVATRRLPLPCPERHFILIRRDDPTLGDRAAS